MSPAEQSDTSILYGQDAIAETTSQRDEVTAAGPKSEVATDETIHASIAMVVRPPPADSTDTADPAEPRPTPSRAWPSCMSRDTLKSYCRALKDGISGQTSPLARARERSFDLGASLAEQIMSSPTARDAAQNLGSLAGLLATQHIVSSALSAAGQDWIPRDKILLGSLVGTYVSPELGRLSIASWLTDGLLTGAIPFWGSVPAAARLAGTMMTLDALHGLFWGCALHELSDGSSDGGETDDKSARREEPAAKRGGETSSALVKQPLQDETSTVASEEQGAAAAAVASGQQGDHRVQQVSSG